MKKEFFSITKVSRDDLEARGFNVDGVTNDQMETLASKMENAYLESSYWLDLDFIASDYLQIPKRARD